MDSINSVSQGTFLFKNGPSLQQAKKTKLKTLSSSIPGSEEWYYPFCSLWKKIGSEIDQLTTSSYSLTLANLMDFVQNASTDCQETQGNLQTSVLLTGVNQTDHILQFKNLERMIKNNSYSLVASLPSTACPTMNKTVEALVSEFMGDRMDENEENPLDSLKKNQLTISVLEAWFLETYSKEEKPKLVLILPDVEQFNHQVLQSLMSVLSARTENLPLLLVLGIATSLKSLHRLLPFHITSKLNVHVFKAESPTIMLNKILEQVILNHNNPFQLSAKSLTVLMDTFRFYDYSLKSFIAGYRVLMLDHFYQQPYHSLCTNDTEEFRSRLSKLNKDDLDVIRRTIPSFRSFVERQPPKTQIDILTSDNQLKQQLLKQVPKIKTYWFDFYCWLRVLVVMIEDLPRNQLGKSLRELYPYCAGGEITQMEQFQEMMKLLRFSSKDILLAKLENVLAIFQDQLENHQKVSLTIETLTKLQDRILSGDSKKENIPEITEKIAESAPTLDLKGISGRQQMLEKLKQSAKQNPVHQMSGFERAVSDCVEFLLSSFNKCLRPLSRAPAFNELFVFHDIQRVRRQIVGAPRGALHTALNDPHYYLQCSCCTTNDQLILPHLPDVCIAYKLHLECPKFINLYDWLLAFKTVLENDDVSDDPQLQARFIRAISELQFLGYIKAAKQKTDHVVRLTW